MTNDEIQRLKQKLVDLESDFDAFVYAVSHDISTPLRHIDGFSRRVLKRLRGSVDEDSEKDLGIVVSSAKKCQRDLDILRQYSRLKTKLRKVDSVDLDAVLARAVDDYAELIEESHAKIVVDALGVCPGDLHQLTQLFSALIDNALRYRSKRSRPEIVITCEDRENLKTISIRDNGIGVAEKYLDRVFVIFCRGVDPDAYEGRGCGLAFAKKIVFLHGGDIRLVSQENIGTEVRFTLELDGST